MRKLSLAGRIGCGIVLGAIALFVVSCEDNDHGDNGNSYAGPVYLFDNRSDYPVSVISRPPSEFPVFTVDPGRTYVLEYDATPLYFAYNGVGGEVVEVDGPSNEMIFYNAN